MLTKIKIGGVDISLKKSGIFEMLERKTNTGYILSADSKDTQMGIVCNRALHLICNSYKPLNSIHFDNK